MSAQWVLSDLSKVAYGDIIPHGKSSDSILGKQEEKGQGYMYAHDWYTLFLLIANK